MMLGLHFAIYSWVTSDKTFLSNCCPLLTHSFFMTESDGRLLKGHIYDNISHLPHFFASCIFCVTFIFIDNSAVRSFPYTILLCYLGGFLSLRLSPTYSFHFLTVGIPQDSVFCPLTLLTVCTFFICMPLSP